MRISRIELFRVKIPLAAKKPGFFSEHPHFQPSWIPGFNQSEMRFYMVKISTDSGLEGFSAMPAMGTERDGIGSLLGNYLLGLNPMDTALINQRIQEMSYIGMRSGWLEIAIWDIIGKALGQPVWKVLGGDGGHIYPYASTGSTHNHDPEYAYKIVKKHVNEGYWGVKLRVKSSEMAPMVEYIAAAREAAGKDVALMVDANQGWPVDIVDETPKWDLKFALDFVKKISKYKLAWLEEPLNKGNLEGLAKLRKQSPVPIAGGEMNSSWLDFKNMLSMGCLDVYQPDAVLAGGTYAGGISVVYWLIQKILEHNKKKKSAKDYIRFSPHTWTTGLGFAAALHLYGLIPQEERFLVEYPYEGNWHPDHWGRFIKGGFYPDRDGRIQIPDAPGLGVEVDMKVIRKFGKRVADCTKGSVAKSALMDRGLKAALYLKKKKEEQVARSEAVEFRIPTPPF